MTDGQSDKVAASRTQLWLASLFALSLIGFFVRSDADHFREVFRRLSDAFHYPYFLFATVAFGLILPARYRELFSREAFAGLCSVILVFLIEVIQPFFGRSGSESDVFHGLLGAGVGFVLLRLYLNPQPRWKRRTAVLASIALFGVLLLPAKRAFDAQVLQAAQFPLLGDFERDEELVLWQTTGPTLTSPNYLGRTTTWAKRGKWSLIFSSKGDKFAGIEYAAGEQDWRGYEELVIPIALLNGDAEVTVRIDDDEDCSAFSDRFNRSFSLVAGEHVLRIPVTDIQHGPTNRKLNVARIKRVIIFFAPHILARVLMIDDIRLEKAQKSAATASS